MRINENKSKKNMAMTYAIIGLIAAIIGAISFFGYRYESQKATKEINEKTKKEIIDNQNLIKKEIIEGQKFLKDQIIVTSTELSFKSSFLYDQLSQKYPYGFKVFGLLKSGEILLGKNIEEPNMEISADWENLKITPNYIDSIITIVMPKVKFKTKWKKKGGSELSVNVNSIIHTVRILPSGKETLMGNIAALGVPLPFFESLDKINETPIYVIGYREMTKREIEVF